MSEDSKHSARHWSGDKLLHFLVKAGLTSIGVRVVGLTLGLISHILLTRALGASYYGQYAVAMGWCMILVVPAKFGMDHTVLKYASVYFSAGQRGALKHLTRYSFWFLGLSCTLIAAVILGATAALPGIFGVAGYVDALWVSLLVLCMAFLGVFSNFLRAAKKIFLSQFFEQVVRSCLLIVMLVLTLLSGTAFGLGNALFLTSMSAALALILLLQRLPALIGDGRDASETLIDRRAWLHLSWPIFFVAVSQQLMAQSQVILLGWFSTTEQAGIYAIAVRISALVAFALAAVSTVSGPSVAAAYERDDYAELRRLAYLSARLCFAAAVAVIAVLVIFGHQILLLFGDEFAGAYPAMLILLLGGAVNAFTGTVGHFLAMTGRQITLLWIMLGTAFLSITLALLLIPSMGSVGAAWASVSGLVLSNIAMVIAVRRELGIDSTAFGLPLAPGAKYLD